MRLPSQRRRSTARQTQSLGSSLLGMVALAPALAQAVTFNPVPSANLDFSKLGRIGIVGDFSGISLYEFEGQSSRARSTNGSESLLAQLPNGALGSLVSSDASIRAMCAFQLSNGDMQGVVIGGNFTSLDGTLSKAIALFNPNTTEITPLSGLEGEVNAVLCDQERDTVYVGGNFIGANSTNAIAWVGTNGWTNLPFAGFNGPVNAITKASNGHIIFGGVFTGLGNTSTPSQPDGQSINLSKANISASNSASTAGFSDPENIVCSEDTDTSGSTWLLEDETAGYWEADFGFMFKPTKLRLWNTQHEDRGTKTFRFLAFPINGIMNLTYTDPDTGKNQTCTSECPLNDVGEYQDFHFINQVGMNQFRIAISDWYGSGGGLAGIELFQDGIFAYAVTDFNEPACGDIEFPSSATATGPWSESPSLESSSQYLTAELTGNFSKSASVVFFPNIKESGNYSVNMYTPGCQQDGSCLTRGRVNVTGVMQSTDSSDFTTTLFQTNNFDKYDQIYFGYIEASSDSFKSAITLSATDDQDVDTLTIVAQRVGFTLIDSTGGLNGLFDFNPDDAVVNTSSIQNSTINKLGASFDGASGVTSLVTDGETTYVGGNFTSDDHDNILAIIKAEDVKTLDGGLNGKVLSMYLNDTKLFVGGDFSNTENGSVTGMDNVAVYDTKEDSWSALGAGVDGTVEYVVPLRINITDDTPETVIALSGVFSQCNEFDDNDVVSVDGFAIWVPSKSNWLQNLGGSLPGYSGVLTAAILDLPDNGGSLFAGSISSAQLGANSAATLSDDGLGQFPLTVQPQSSSSNSSVLSRRDVVSVSDISGVATGLFYDENDKNITVLAGHFTTQSTDGDEINNIVLIEDDKAMGLSSNISSDSTFVTLALRGSTLFAGGSVSGTVNENEINGILAYNIESKSFGSQPPPLSGGNSTVNAIAVRPGSADVYVGGSFDLAGALDCPGVCTYSMDSDQWNRPGSEVSGIVHCLMWTSEDDLIVGGDLSANGSDTRYLASWDAKKESWSDFPSADEIPGSVQVLAPASSDKDQIWIAGTSTDDDSVFIMKFDGDKWQTAKPALLSDSIVRGLQIFTLTEEHDDSDILDKKQVLMITGSLVLPSFGVASAAIFNGTTYQPYALTINSDNSAGSIAGIFSQKDDFFSSDENHMPLVFVILIGLAISLGLMLLLVLAGIILDRIRKKREGYTPAPTSMYDRGSGIQRVPPHELFESLGQGRAGAPHV
ncbi:cortical protein marker for cell polarity-domain-containing protein [Dactylonectria estremocensis]|uniref:Cortical protein marker for cell polarity-domain-containing protein n=1 Tax=Dactylonectria estremocensis TaxID=1079267 RepID=A0A9P9JER3_9HYPO|nr:cortical protein marker for cell polarity-domain-containing protein [Dactylonectria estremocensis]